MTATVAELVAFLEAQIAEDERVAREANPSPWGVYEIVPGSSTYGISCGGGAVSAPGGDYFGAVDLSDAAHIARHDPARVLADCEAKREILADALDADRRDEHGRGADTGTMGEAMAYAAVLRALALAFKGADGWQEEWADE